MQPRVFANTKDMPRETWLKMRRKGIGGSDAAAILGMSHYSTPYSVYADKVGALPEKDDTEAMRQGRDLEEYVAQRFTDQTGIRVRRRNQMLQNPEHPFMLADIDRECVGLNGIRAGLEIKTTRDIYLKRFKDGEYPDEYYCQCMHYMAVTGWERWYLAVLVYGTDFMIFQIDRDEDEIQALIKAEEAFWNDFEKGIAPPVDGRAPTETAVDAMYPSVNEGDDEVQLSCGDAISNYMALEAQIKLLERERDRNKEIIQCEMQDAPKAVCGAYRVVWKPSVRSKLDIKRYIADHGKIDADYYKTTVSRRFAIKEVK